MAGAAALCLAHLLDLEVRVFLPTWRLAVAAALRFQADAGDRDLGLLFRRHLLLSLLPGPGLLLLQVHAELLDRLVVELRLLGLLERVRVINFRDFFLGGVALRFIQDPLLELLYVQQRIRVHAVLAQVRLLQLVLVNLLLLKDLLLLFEHHFQLLDAVFLRLGTRHLRPLARFQN